MYRRGLEARRALGHSRAGYGGADSAGSVEWSGRRREAQWREARSVPAWVSRCAAVGRRRGVWPGLRARGGRWSDIIIPGPGAWC